MSGTSCGSIASSVHGLARASVDADVVAELAPEHVASLLAALSGSFYLSEERMRDAVARKGSFNVIHLETMVKVDVFISKDRPFDRRAMERARPHFAEGTGGRAYRMASAEDIILAELEWYRRGGDVSERQWTDVLGVLRANGSLLSLPYLESGASDLGVGDLLQRALSEATAEPER